MLANWNLNNSHFTAHNCVFAQAVQNHNNKTNMTQLPIDTNTHLGIDTIYIEISAAPQVVDQCDLGDDVQTNKLELSPQNVLIPACFLHSLYHKTISSRQLTVGQHTFTATGDGRRPKEKERKKARRLLCHRMYNLLVRRVVFPVSVVSRCPRQIAEWKG